MRPSVFFQMKMRSCPGKVQIRTGTHGRGISRRTWSMPGRTPHRGGEKIFCIHSWIESTLPLFPSQETIWLLTGFWFPGWACFRLWSCVFICLNQDFHYQAVRQPHFCFSARTDSYLSQLSKNYFTFACLSNQRKLDFLHFRRVEFSPKMHEREQNMGGMQEKQLGKGCGRRIMPERPGRIVALSLDSRKAGMQEAVLGKNQRSSYPVYACPGSTMWSNIGGSVHKAWTLIQNAAKQDILH